MDDERISLTYAQLAELLKRCKQDACDTGSMTEPEGYSELAPEAVKVADACWYKGMDDLENAVLNEVFDVLASARNEQNAAKTA